MGNGVLNDDGMLSMLICDEDNVAFIKEERCDSKWIWEIYDADGTKLAATDNRECAFIVAKQNDFNPYSVH